MVTSHMLWSPVSCSDRLRCTSTSRPLLIESLPIGPKTRASHRACTSVPAVRSSKHAACRTARERARRRRACRGWLCWLQGTCTVASAPRRTRCTSPPSSCITMTSIAAGSLSAPSPEKVTERGLRGRACRIEPRRLLSMLLVSPVPLPREASRSCWMMTRRRERVQCAECACRVLAASACDADVIKKQARRLHRTRYE